MFESVIQLTDKQSSFGSLHNVLFLIFEDLLLDSPNEEKNSTTTTVNNNTKISYFELMMLS